LIPHWAKDPKIAYKTINARAETVDTALSYRQAFEKRRCLIPANGFYEWRTISGMKVPFSIGLKNDCPFVCAGLWEGWKDPSTDQWLRTSTIITGDPNDLVAQIHTRMPVILPEEHHGKCLGEVEDGGLKGLLKPFPADQMKMWLPSGRGVEYSRSAFRQKCAQAIQSIAGVSWWYFGHTGLPLSLGHS
jgi:putative SOS response-associated peptidase YedK